MVQKWRDGGQAIRIFHGVVKRFQVDCRKYLRVPI